MDVQRMELDGLRRIEGRVLVPVDALLVRARCAYDTQYDASDVVAQGNMADHYANASYWLISGPRTSHSPHHGTLNYCNFQLHSKDS